jgi:cell division protease FtsH
MPPRRSWLTFLLILLVNYALVRMLFPRGESAVTVPYTLFKQEITKRNVEKIYSRGESIRGRFRAPITYPTRVDTANAGVTARCRPRSVRII